MDETARLGLPLLAAAQAQKHVTHNEALLALDALVHLACLDRNLAAPPASPADGDRYIVAAAPSGAWAGHPGEVAEWRDGVWHLTPARAGFLAYVADEGCLLLNDGSGWREIGTALGPLQRLSRLGLGMDADDANPFSAKLNGALWTARTVGEGGSGNVRVTLNKEAPAGTATFLFQTGYSGRAEFGLAGGDGFSVKVSPDGSAWRTALAADPSTGGVDFLAASTDLAAAATTDLGAAPTRAVRLTGTATVTSFGTAAHKERLLAFAGGATLVPDGVSLVLPGGAPVTAAPGDTALATSDGAGNWTVRHYQRADGRALVETFAGYGANFVPVADNAISLGTPSRRFGSTYTAALSAGTVTVSNLGSFSLADTSGHVVQFPTIQGDDNIVYYSTRSDGATYPIFAQLANRPSVQPLVFYVGLEPGLDNALPLGRAGSRWSAIYAASGTISTSDARQKTAIAPLSAAEMAAASQLAREVGTFQFLDAIAAKGADRARRHVGLTVQRALDVMGAHGLDPCRYGLICHDRWDGVASSGALPGREAGDLWSFRPDELALFIARAQEERLARLEARLPPSGPA